MLVSLYFLEMHFYFFCKDTALPYAFLPPSLFFFPLQAMWLCKQLMTVWISQETLSTNLKSLLSRKIEECQKSQQVREQPERGRLCMEGEDKCQRFLCVFFLRMRDG